MHCFTIAAVLASAAAVNAFVVPVGTPNGVYEHTVDADGKEWHRRIGNLTDGIPHWNRHRGPVHNTWSRFGRRDVKPNSKHLPGGVTCAPSGAILTEQDINFAAFTLGNTCDESGAQYVPHNGARYAVSGNAMVYMCNMKGSDQGCTSSSVDSYIPAVLDTCHDASGTYTQSFRSMHNQ
jgi:hypothetical protein